jgi:flagellar hook assembly protein FlgD
MLWDSRSGIERSIKETQYEKGYTNLFEKNGTTMLKADFEREGKTVLYDAWPNPSSRQTTFRFTLEAESDVTLELYNSRGNLVKVLVKGKLYGGDHSIEWNNSAGPGEKVAGGVYFYRLKSNNFNQTRKLVIR